MCIVLYCGFHGLLVISLTYSWQCELALGGESGLLVGQVSWQGAWPAVMVHILLVCNKYHANQNHGYYVCYYFLCP